MKRNIIISSAVFTLLILLFLTASVRIIPAFEPSVRGVIKKDIPSGYFFEIPVILYHNIDGAGPFSVTSAQLESHFRFFRDNNVIIVSLGKLDELLEKGLEPEKKYAIICFDDGYPSMKSKLLPIAKKYGYPVTLFIYTDFVGKPGGKLLSWEDLRMLDTQGLQVESHTVSHADLLKAEKEDNPVVLYREIYISKRIIEMMLDKNVDHLAFPYGSYDRNIKFLAEAAGYKRLHTVEFGANIAGNNNVLIKRHHVKRNYTIDTIRRILEMK